MEIKLKLQNIVRKQMPAKQAHRYMEQDDVFFTLKYKEYSDDLITKKKQNSMMLQS